MRIALLDTYYESALRDLEGVRPELASMDYAGHLKGLLDCCFGTSFFWSQGLRDLGHEVIDIIPNHVGLQSKWHNQNFGGDKSFDLVETAVTQILAFRPDVLFLQDVGWFPASILSHLKKSMLIAGQISCPLPEVSKVQCVDVMFTSFPHFVGKFKTMGVRRREYMPLAFEPSVVDRALDGRPLPSRDLDIVFVGGLNRSVYWAHGTRVLEGIAARFPKYFHWWGYGVETLPSSSPLKACYHGRAWGLDMYRAFLRAKIVVNRHHDEASGYTNNMRCFEATGCGACLFTEESPNLRALFPDGTAVAYAPANLHGLIEMFCGRPEMLEKTAEAGRQHTLGNHTYKHRMVEISRILEEELRR